MCRTRLRTRSQRQVPPVPDLCKPFNHTTTTGKDILLYFCLPIFAVTSYAADVKEREKMRHRF